MVTYVQCHTTADALMYAAVLREEGYKALVQTATNPTMVEIEVAKVKNEESVDDALFDIYSRRVAN